MDSLNTKGNIKRKWGKRERNKALIKTSLMFPLTWKRRTESATIFVKRPKRQIQNHIETSVNSYHIEASQLTYIANQFSGPVWGLFLLNSFWKRLSRFSSPVATDWANVTTSFWQYHSTGLLLAFYSGFFGKKYLNKSTLC